MNIGGNDGGMNEQSSSSSSQIQPGTHGEESSTHEEHDLLLPSSNMSEQTRRPATLQEPQQPEQLQREDVFPAAEYDIPPPSPSVYPMRRASFLFPTYQQFLSQQQPAQQPAMPSEQVPAAEKEFKEQANLPPGLERRRSSVLSMLMPRPSLQAQGITTATTIPRLFEEVRQSIDIVHDAQVQDVKRQKERKRRHITTFIKSHLHKKEVEQAHKKIVKIEEHEMSLEKVCEMYGTQFNVENPEGSYGLSQQVAEERLKVNGPNQFAPPKGAGILCFINVIIDRTPASFPNIFLGAILWLVVIMNAIITLAQEHSSEKTMAAFLALQTANCMVLREGIMQRVDVKELVLGDLVVINAGDKVPADLRVLSCNNLKMDNSSLTGESEPQSRSVESNVRNSLEATNLLFFGTIAVDGNGIGVVIRTGNATVIGQIAVMAQTSTQLKTPLGRQIDHFVRTIGSISLIMAVIFFIIGLALGNSWFVVFLYSIGIVVANIPQGLLATMTLCLTVSARRLQAVNVLAKKLEHVETLGGVSCLCSDKTGTLTQNRMTVVEMWADGAFIDVRYNRMMKQKPSGNLTNFSDISENDLTTEQKIVRCCALCSKTIFVENELNLQKPILDRECIGDASETALIKFVETRENSSTLVDIRRQFPKQYDIPFNSKNKWMLTIHECVNKDLFEHGQLLTLIKGAPERVIGRCNSMLMRGQIVPLNEDLKEHFQDAYNFMASKGERVLGLAQRFTSAEIVNTVKVREEMGAVESATKEQQGIQAEASAPTIALASESREDLTTAEQQVEIPTDGFCFLGMIALTDPPKVGVPEAVAKCKRAGIQVVMVTGDHPTTAKAIAKQVGIIDPGSKTREDLALEEGVNPEDIPWQRVDAVVLHGEQIDRLSEEEWRTILRKKQVVFSRTSPQQKLIIVSRFQQAGHCTAVTGDGTNDSPALKKADIGIAMNISGSDVSKEAAALILLDDNFASIINGVEEGRLIFDNLKKSIVYTLAHLLPELIPFLLFVLVGFPAAISGLLALCIDLGTDLISATCLAYETKESDIMSIPPRPRTELLVGFRVLSVAYLQLGVIMTFAAFTSFFLCMGLYGIPPGYLYRATYLGYFGLTSTKYLYIAESGLMLSPLAQLDILSTAQAAFFLAIVICQWFTLFAVRTRRMSLFTQGLFTNLAVYFGIIYAIIIAVIVIYVPFIGDYIIATRPLLFMFWLLPLPWGVFIIIYDEVRKWLIRRLYFTPLLW
ncbi:hypothetical protein C9374_012266 [Naegleria lovaniensis]|uniref:Cation-transporting P-type ATPase N-terminal domain-containing protein n=1 Tax=Naegleria lovaniensis TaxID=51637 RepID=A0AA88G820_NAELO|nr:uncharacterized protein C9374_012266 [Naegleria lovaniensis]KAG2373277.1 hypothetical protein C9374_012266 [Naegleria lovaniensis]